MARSLFSRFLSGTAGLALAILLTACGGGGNATNQVANPLATAVKAPDTGLAFDGQPRKKALAAGALTSEITFTVSEGMAVLSDRKTILAAGNLFGGVSIEETLNWAEGEFPDLFPRGPVSGDTVFRDVAYTYRYYPGPENYLGITPEGFIFGYGSFTGLMDQVRPYGHIRDWACQVAPTKCGVVAVEPAHGATGVDFRSATITLTYNVRLESCTAMSGRVVFGAIAGSASCVNQENGGSVITIVPDRLPVGTTLTGSIRNQRDTMGYPVPDFTWSFTTRNMVVANKLYVGDLSLTDGSSAVHVIDAFGAVAKEIGFPAVPGFGSVHDMMADPLTGRLIVVPWSTFRVYFVDMETDNALPPLDVNATPSVGLVTKGLFLNGTDYCTAFTRSVPWLEVNNQLACFDRLTDRRTLTTANNFLAQEAMWTLRIRSVEDKIYLVNGLGTAFDNPSGVWTPGTPGELRVLNPTTYVLERRVAVGAVPVDFAVHPVTGDVWVINGGDKTLSIVHPDDRVETVPLPGYPDTYQRPTSIVLDVEKNRFYITDYINTVVVYDLTTRQEVQRVVLDPGYVSPRFMTIIGGELHVANAAGASISVVDRDTLTVVRTITGLGRYPNAIVGVP